MDPLANDAFSAGAVQRFREEKTAMPDGLLSPSPCLAFEDEYTPLRSSLETSSPASLQGSNPWNATIVFNKALSALKVKKASFRSSGLGKGDKPPAATAPSRAETSPCRDVTSPQHITSILLTSTSVFSSDDCCTPSGANCNRRLGASKRSSGNATISSTITTFTNTTAAPSPISSPSTASKEHGSGNCSSTFNINSPKPATSRGFLTPTRPTAATPSPSSPLNAAWTALQQRVGVSLLPLPLATNTIAAAAASGSKAAEPAAAASPRSTSTAAVTMVGAAAVGQAAGASAALVRQAISAPLVKVGVLRKSKEKLE